MPPAPVVRALRAGLHAGPRDLPRAGADVAGVHEVHDGRRRRVARRARAHVLLGEAELRGPRREAEAGAHRGGRDGGGLRGRPAAARP